MYLEALQRAWTHVGVIQPTVFGWAVLFVSQGPRLWAGGIIEGAAVGADRVLKMRAGGHG
jgi:hypothetical protein